MQRILCLALLSFATVLTAADKPYDFRASAAYKKLTATDRQRLEQVCRDLVMLWGALDMYCDQHDGNPPRTLDELVPRFLAELPADPFATKRTAGDPEASGYTRSKGGFGYRFRKGAPGNTAWVIASVGLPDFPYLAERGNIGLYVCKGFWTGGGNPMLGRLFKAEGPSAKDTSPPAEVKTRATKDPSPR